MLKKCVNQNRCEKVLTEFWLLTPVLKTQVNTGKRPIHSTSYVEERSVTFVGKVMTGCKQRVGNLLRKSVKRSVFKRLT